MNIVILGHATIEDPSEVDPLCQVIQGSVSLQEYLR